MNNFQPSEPTKVASKYTRKYFDSEDILLQDKVNKTFTKIPPNCSDILIMKINYYFQSINLSHLI